MGFNGRCPLLQRAKKVEAFLFAVAVTPDDREGAVGWQMGLGSLPQQVGQQGMVRARQALVLRGARGVESE